MTRVGQRLGGNDDRQKWWPTDEKKEKRTKEMKESIYERIEDIKSKKIRKMWENVTVCAQQTMRDKIKQIWIQIKIHMYCGRVCRESENGYKRENV